MSTCDWPVDDTCLPPLPEESDPDYEAAVAQRDNAVNTAIAVLWALSGRQYSCNQVTARPSPIAHGSLCDDAPLIEAYYRNDWRGIPASHFSPMVVMLEGPVHEIIEVRIDGAVVDPAEYAVEENRLYRLGKRWPRNDMSKPAGLPGTWTVTYIKGYPPPSFVAPFVGELANEMLHACNGGKCRLPRTVISTSRSGVTHVFDPTRMLAAGFTGLPNVDTWLASVNPNRLSRTAHII